MSKLRKEYLGVAVYMKFVKLGRANSISDAYKKMDKPCHLNSNDKKLNLCNWHVKEILRYNA